MHSSDEDTSFFTASQLLYPEKQPVHYLIIGKSATKYYSTQYTFNVLLVNDNMLSLLLLLSGPQKATTLA